MPSKKRHGPRIALRRQNSAGVGKSIPESRTKQHVNLKPCGTCGAKAGQACFRLTGQSFVELNHTHSGREVRRDEYVERTTRMSADELVERYAKRSTPVLDGRLELRDQRKVSRQKWVNGG